MQVQKKFGTVSAFLLIFVVVSIPIFGTHCNNCSTIWIGIPGLLLNLQRPARCNFLNHCSNFSVKKKKAFVEDPPFSNNPL